ncbi:glycosyltransferase involved in cell wall biosynthesis [Actinopolyspora biskrensis]|uniref:Glycosyltransferase involved in cell wall biosynthesis n=1 Tax=Actinopolyspora biskrensis TaxID=1470178 RepID=A0A852YYY6_9ACTN|nr:glycosyltransferase family 1 protein [Actinopolyspora biskrensis]NYH79388.1 glycosyltransferase involved in cell wall biosynthesis [Actinopolyspora biskrensis]
MTNRTEDFSEMRVVLDGTPLLGRRTGIGRYTARLAAELGAAPECRPRLLGLTTRGWRELRRLAPEGTGARGVPAPARLLHSCWAFSEFPPVELLTKKADLVHGTNFVQPPSGRVPGVLTVHDLDFLDAVDGGGGNSRARLTERSVRRSSVVCTPTEAVAARVAERFDLDRRRIVVTPLGVDREWFEAPPPDEALRREYGLPREYLLFVGDGGPRKGLSTLAGAVDARLPPLVTAGPGRAVPETRLPGGGTVVRTGYLPEHVLRRVVAGAGALVLPSRDEGFGLPALEAMAAGVPVVCSDIPALREVTAGHALLAAHGDGSALRAALHRAVGSAADRDVRRRAREHAAGFTWRGCAEATLRAYRLALAGE